MLLSLHKEPSLPKLTTEVFNKEDCPEWANYAAVDRDGLTYYFESKPFFDDTSWGNKLKGNVKLIRDIEGNGMIFDSSNWKNSLIERHIKVQLPDWCKVGEWCYCLDDDGNPKYFKITRIEDGFIYGEDWDIDYHFVRQARLRPYNAEEMRGLVGKIVQFEEFYNLVIMYDGRNNEILVGDGDWLSESSLLNDYTIDGPPCGVLVHLENGKWVK